MHFLLLNDTEDSIVRLYGTAQVNFTLLLIAAAVSKHAEVAFFLFSMFRYHNSGSSRSTSFVHTLTHEALNNKVIIIGRMQGEEEIKKEKISLRARDRWIVD